MRALGVDLGSKRIGIAVSDRSGTIASPLTVVARDSADSRGFEIRVHPNTGEFVVATMMCDQFTPLSCLQPAKAREALVRELGVIPEVVIHGGATYGSPRGTPIHDGSFRYAM